MSSQHQFLPRLDSLEDRLAPASIQLTLPHVGTPISSTTSNIVLTLPTTPPVVPPPPTDDTYEDNDSFANVRDLGTLIGGSLNSEAAKSLTGLMLTDNADWFSFTTTRTGTVGSGVNIRFSNLEGNLNLRLFNSVGEQLAASRGTGDREAVSLAGRPAGTYIVQVRGLAGVHNPSYSLGVKQAVLTITPTVPPVTPPVAPPPVVPPTIPPPPLSGFNIDLRYNGLTPSQQLIFQQAANRWGQVIIGDLPDASFQGIFVDDLLIDATAIPIDGVGGVAGRGGPDFIRTTGTGLPIHGNMSFDTADLAELEANGSLFTVALHEMGHVLGFGTLWTDKLLLIGADSINPVFVGPAAILAYNQIFGTTVAGVPVENVGGVGSINSHWRETIFKTEVMTATLNEGILNPLSRVTVASMSDLGYVVNLNAADPLVP